MAAHGEPVSRGEVLTPVQRDWPSAIPFAVSCAQTLIDPSRVDRLSRSAINPYRITPAVFRALKHTLAQPD
jgi:hypothetical protein